MGAAAAHQQRRVVHPGVVRAQLAQADQPQREVAVVAVRDRASDPLDLGRDLGGSRCTRPSSWRILLARARRRRCARRARSRAALRASRFEAQAAAAQPEQVALRADAQQQVDQPPRRELRTRAVPSQPQRRSTLEGTTPIRAEISSMTSHSWRASPARLDDRLGHLDERRGEERRGTAAGRPRARGTSSPAARSRRGGGLVHVEVERDAELELAERRLELVAVRAPTAPGCRRRRRTPGSGPRPAS